MKPLRKPLNRIICLAVFVCSSVFSSINFAQTLAGNNTASIAGRVTSAGKPIADVTIVATNGTTYDGRAIARGKTDYDGNYRIEGLPAGTFRLLPLAQPYVLLKAEGPYEMRGQTINVSAGEAVEQINFQLIRGGVITGRITDTEGDPVIGEQVSVMRTNNQWEMWLYETERYRTDDRGIYRIYGLEPGEYRVSVGQDRPSSVNSMTARFGSLYAKTYYPGTTKQSQAKLLELNEGDVLSNVDLIVGKLPTGFAISGQVVDNAGKPMPNVNVGYSSLEGKREGIGQMNIITPPTDSNGKFRADGLPPGKYGAFTLAGPAQAGLYSELSKFEVVDADVTGIVIKLNQGVTISGVAVVENNPEAAVLEALQTFQLYAHSADPERGPAPSYAITNIQPDSTFILSGLSPGKVRIGIQQFPRPPKGFNLSRIEVDGAITTALDVSAGANLTNVRLIFTYGIGSLKGQVKVEGGTLPEGARLYVALRQPNQVTQSYPQSIEVDARGRFFADNIPPGNYEVSTRIVVARENSSKQAPETRQVTITHNVETEVTLVVSLTPGNERP